MNYLDHFDLIDTLKAAQFCAILNEFTKERKSGYLLIIWEDNELVRAEHIGREDVS